MAIKRRGVLTHEMLMDVMTYDPDTGIFIWKKPIHVLRIGTEAGGITPIGYRYISINRVRYQAHRLAWLYHYGEWPSLFIDHINLIKSDNRISNLRLATKRQNGANTRKKKNNTTGFKGVYHWEGRFHAQIRMDGKKKYLGSYASAELASKAFVDAHKELWGEFHHPGQ